jgi:hypothetical protein
MKCRLTGCSSKIICHTYNDSFQDSGDESKEEEWVEKVVRTSEEACAHETCEKAGRTHSGPNQDEYRPKNDVSHEKQGIGFYVLAGMHKSLTLGCHGD